MAEYIHLVGAEQVQQAGNTMRNAADEMQHAVKIPYGVLFQQRQFMDDWLNRLQTIMEAKHE